MAKRSNSKKVTIAKSPRGKRRRHDIEGAPLLPPGEQQQQQQPQSTATADGAQAAGQGAKKPRPPPSTSIATAAWPSAGPLPPPMAVDALPASMAAALRASGLDAPTDVQRRVWPCCLLGRDTVGVAPTGSGKTLGYALPLAELLSSWEPLRSASPRSASPLALVLVPTRELCQQAARAMERALSSAAGGVRVLALHGGEARSAQRAALANATAPLHVVVATPGRLLDLAGAGSLSSGGGDVSGAGAGNEGIGMGGGSIFSSSTTTTGRGAPPMSNPSTAALDLTSVRYVVFDEADKLLTSADLAEQCCRLHALTHPQMPTGFASKNSSLNKLRQKVRR